MAAFLEVKVLCEGALVKKEFPLSLALKVQKLSKAATTEPSLVVAAVKEGGVQLMLEIMKQVTGTMRTSATKLLVALLSRSEGLDQVVECRRELFALLYEDVYSDRLDVFVYALELLSILVGYFEDSFQLVDKVAREAAEKRKEVPFAPLVGCLTSNSTDAQMSGALILCVLMERSMVLGSMHPFVELLRRQNISQLITALRAKTQQLDVHTSSGIVLTQEKVAEQLCMHLDNLGEWCGSGDENIKEGEDEERDWQASVVRHQSELIVEEATRSSTSKLASRVAALTGIAKIAGMPTDERVLMQALTQHLHEMETKLNAMNAEQQQQAARAIEQQQQAMEKQLQLQRDLFEQKLAVLSKDGGLCSVDRTQAALSLELQALKDNQALLMAEHAKNQHNVAEQAYLRQHKQLWLFYQCIQLKLNEVLLGYKVMASRLDPGEYATELTLAGQSVPLPGPTDVSTMVTNTVDQWKPRNKASNARVASGITVSVNNMEQISEQCARSLCFRYETQIRQLEEKGAKLLGECGVLRMMESLKLGCFDSLQAQTADNHAIVESLVGSVAALEVKQSAALKHQEIATLVPRPKKHRWHENNIFKKPGVKTLEGDYYSCASCDVAQYGYRLGTAEEARALGYTLDNFTKASSIDSEVSCFHTSPKLKALLASRSSRTRSLSNSPERPQHEGAVSPMASSFPGTSARAPPPPQRRSEQGTEVRQLFSSPAQKELPLGPSPAKAQDDNRDQKIAELQAELAEMKLRMAKMEDLVMSLVAQKS